MLFTKSSLLSLFAVASSALACVDFSANLRYNGMDDDCPFAAALTDNGQQKCQIHVTDSFCGGPAANEIIQLSCLDGYYAFFNLGDGVVTYWYGSFWGQFNTNNHGDYWTAKTWVVRWHRGSRRSETSENFSMYKYNSCGLEGLLENKIVMEGMI